MTSPEFMMHTIMDEFALYYKKGNEKNIIKNVLSKYVSTHKAQAYA